MKLLDYECKTTFWMDFSIADRFGIAAVPLPSPLALE